MPSTFSHIVEEAQQLDTGAKQELVELLLAWLAEERREHILLHARESESEYAEGKTKTGGIDDLMADLYEHD